MYNTVNVFKYIDYHSKITIFDYSSFIITNTNKPFKLWYFRITYN